MRRTRSSTARPLAGSAGAQARLVEAEETLRAIRHGEVDALVVSTSAPGDQVFTLSGADRPYRIFVENMQEGAATLSSTGVVLFANDRLGLLLGCAAAAVVARQMSEFVVEADRDRLAAAVGSATVGTTFELRLQRADEGSNPQVVWVLAGLSRLNVDDEQLTCLTFTDLTAEHRLLDEVRASEERYRTIVENAQEGISILDARGHFTFANPRTAELLGYDVADLPDMDGSVLLRSPAVPPTADSRAGQHEVTVNRPDGSSIDLLVSTAPIVMAGSTDTGSVCMISDVSVIRRAEESLAHWAMHDALTGLPNRTLLMDRVDQALARAHRQAGDVAALFCDLDGFKEINDSRGHHDGDEVLRAISTRLRGAVRPADTVARIGGDEFVVLSEDMDHEAAVGLASRVLEAVAAPLDVGGHDVPLSVSVGVAFGGSNDAAQLLRNADAAMYLAKQRGGNRAELFDEELRRVAAQRMRLIADLHHAVEKNELRLHYQPMFSLADEKLVGVEALVRWEHPERGLLLPLDFISAAESANLIGGIGAWVLRTACLQAATWSGVAPVPPQMAVNISARQLLRGSGLVRLVADVLKESDVDPASLVLEVTESAVMNDAESALAVFTQLKQLGVRLAIDHFGTGYSSLVYLKRLPLDQLKIDRTCVSGLGEDPDDSAVVAGVVGLARSLGIGATAEGVETTKQLDALKGLGCDLGQGYLWSRPRPAADLDRLVRSGLWSSQTEGSTVRLGPVSPDQTEMDVRGPAIRARRRLPRRHG